MKDGVITYDIPYCRHLALVLVCTSASSAFVIQTNGLSVSKNGAIMPHQHRDPSSLVQSIYWFRLHAPLLAT